LSPSNYTLYIVPALAAALAGRLSVIWATVGAALLLGMTQSELLFLQGRSWFPRWAVTGAREGLPFLAVIAILALLGKKLPARGALAVQRLPRVPRRRRPRGLALTVLLAGLALMVVMRGGYRFALMTSAVASMVALSIVVLTGLV